MWICYTLLLDNISELQSVVRQKISNISLINACWERYCLYCLCTSFMSQEPCPSAVVYAYYWWSIDCWNKYFLSLLLFSVLVWFVVWKNELMNYNPNDWARLEGLLLCLKWSRGYLTSLFLFWDSWSFLLFFYYLQSLLNAIPRGRFSLSRKE